MLAVLLALSASAAALEPSTALRRRALLGLGASALVAPVLGTVAPAVAVADEAVDVYFGCGCFWHVQHEFVEAERKILGRADSALTAAAGYAGGRAGASEGKVCYHNGFQTADYGKLGHAEVVKLSVPPSRFGAFAEEYFKLFDGKGNRPDQLGDRGPEYRNLVGLPGGTKSPLCKALVAASQAQGDRLNFATGKGDDADVRATAFVMDTADFPFYQAELYHQFHDGFAWGEAYPEVYNEIGRKLAKAGALKDTGCPRGMLGVGVAGI